LHVVNYLPYDDIGGVGYRTATAFNRLKPEWTYHAYRGAPSYLQFPEHTPWDWEPLVKDWNNADVVHVHDHIPRVGKGKPTVVTFHGTGFRETPDHHLSLAGNARVLVSTLDLWLQKPDDTTWMPQIDDIEWLASHRVPNDGPIRVGHAPTNRSLKTTTEFLEACKRFGGAIEVLLIENQPWHQALRLKGTCDILFDQTLYGYGGNAIEAWGMGIPVICGAPDNTLAEYQRRFGYIPFVNATPTTIHKAIEQLLEPNERAGWSFIGKRHAERFHSQRAGVDLLAPIYEQTTART
jgi:hypothetical protein